MILVLNCGSSSIKFAIVDPITANIPMNGLVECIDKPDARIKWNIADKQTKDLPNISYKDALQFILELISEQQNLFNQIIAVGHRVVHGGEFFTESVVINTEVLNAIKQCQGLAPLHNPANIQGIEVAQQAFPDLPQVAVFDTAFHQTMPEHAYLYAIPQELYTKHQIRRYGFHGTSHRFVAQQAAEILDKPIAECDFVTAHLGNGCSVCAISKGKSVDTSMGLTPLEGLVMGTRSGDIDPGLMMHLVDRLGYDINQVNDLLNKQSGLLGISDLDSDMRNLEEAAENNNPQAKLAIEIFCYRLAKYIAAYAVTLGGIDALIFTGGIGENSTLIRSKTLSWLTALNFHLDAELNATNGDDNGRITKDNAACALVINTNEELMIARDAKACVGD